MDDINLDDEYSINIDYDRLDDPEEARKLKYLREKEKYKKNIILMSEFNEKYSILFNKNEATSLDMETLQKLSQEYVTRIDPYFPVYIIKQRNSALVSELLSKENLVYVLPPMYNRVRVINELGKDAVDVLQAFNNVAALNMDDRFDQKKAKYSKYVSILLDNLNSTEARMENKETSLKLAEKAVQDSNVYRTSGKIEMTPDDVSDIPEDMMEELNELNQAQQPKQEEETVTEEFL